MSDFTELLLRSDDFPLNAVYFFPPTEKGESIMLHFTITDIQRIEPVPYDWGAVKWVCNGEVAPGCEQSFGLVHILPGKTNPLHWHTAAEELVYVLSGECDIKLDDKWHRLTPGLTLHIPPGVRHELKNNGWEPVIYIASFSASMRGTMFDDPDAVGARPTSSLY